MQSRVISRIDCSEPDFISFYIGKSEKIFGYRIKDQRQKSTLKTPNKNASYLNSAQIDHIIEYD